MSTSKIYTFSKDGRPCPFNPLAEAKAKAAAKEQRRKEVIERFIEANRPQVDDTGMANFPGGGGVLMSGGYKPKQWSQPKVNPPAKKEKIQLTERQHRNLEKCLAWMGKCGYTVEPLTGKPLDPQGNPIE